MQQPERRKEERDRKEECRRNEKDKRMGKIRGWGIKSISCIVVSEP